ncbi:MAG: PAS domain S-box protein [Chitinophagaceae bacterium]|nr:PAS domain S-box protein [Chitinophagaceae bacterium]
MDSLLRVLVCEDMETDFFLLVRQLEKAGFEVKARRVYTPQSFLSELKSEDWDIILSDYFIPGFSGVEALEMLKQNGLEVPFILVSGTIGEEAAVHVMRSGASDYLMKDNLARLASVVKRELDEAAIRRERRAAIEQLRANEEKYRAIIDNALFGILQEKPGGLILQANRAACEMFGYTEEEFARLDWKPLFDFNDPAVGQKLAERDRYGSTKAEFLAIRKNGERFYCEVSSVIYRDVEGKEIICNILADITTRKQAEQQMQTFNEELKQLSTHLKNAREDERKHIARELHDQLGQLASAIKIELDWLDIHTTEPAPSKKRIQRALFAVSHMIDTTRKIASSLRPAVLDDEGLNTSLKWQCEEFRKLSGIRCEFHGGIDERLVSAEMRIELFRICQEALTNVLRHAEAGHVSVQMEMLDEEIELSIHDNGKGFDTAKPSSHLGLVGIRERARSVNGKLLIDSAPGAGTTIRIRVPLKTLS